jgi:hypothetical protein
MVVLDRHTAGHEFRAHRIARRALTHVPRGIRGGDERVGHDDGVIRNVGATNIVHPRDFVQRREDQGIDLELGHLLAHDAQFLLH